MTNGCRDLEYHVINWFIMKLFGLFWYATKWEPKYLKIVNAYVTFYYLQPGSRRNARREEVVLARIRLGHTYLTHS